MGIDDDDPDESGAYKRNRWGRAVPARGRTAVLAPEPIERIHAPEVRMPKQSPAWMHADYKPYRRQRPRVKHAFGKGWAATALYMPEPGRPVRVKCRNRGLGTFALRILERGYEWVSVTGDVLESFKVTHWRYPIKRVS